MKSTLRVTQLGLIAALLSLPACNRKTEGGLLVKVTATTAMLPDCVQLKITDSKGTEVSPVLVKATAGGTLFGIRQGDFAPTISMEATLYAGASCAELTGLKIISRASKSATFPSKDVTEVTLDVGAPDSSLDGDGDTYVSKAKGGTDCDDGDADRNPGKAQVCTSMVDTDCNDKAGCEDPACSNASVCGLSIAFNPTAVTPVVGDCTPVALTLRDGMGMPVSAGTTLTFSLNANVGTLSAFSTAACGTGDVINSVTISGNNTQAGLFVKSTQAGMGTVRAELLGKPSVTATLTVNTTEAPVAAIRFLQPTQPNLKAGACGVPITLEAIDARGLPTRTTMPLSIALSASPSSQFEFFDGTCSAPDAGSTAITQVVMPSSQSQVSFRVRGKLVGSYTLTANASRGTPPTATQPIVAADASRLVISPPVVALIRNTCSAGSISVSTTDEFDNAALPMSDVTVTFATSPGTGLSGFAGADATCATPITSVTIPAATGTAALHLQASLAQQFTLTPSAPGFIGLSRQVNVSNELPSKLELAPLASQTTAGQCFGPITVQAVDTTNTPSPVPANTPLSLSTTGQNVAFFASGNCLDGGALTINANNPSTVFSYSTPKAQNFTISVSAPTDAGLAAPAAPHTATIDAGAPSFLQWDSGTSTGNAGDCVAMTLRSFDSLSNPALLRADAGITLSSVDAGLLFSLNSSCTGASNSVVLPSATSTVSVFTTTLQAGTYAASAAVPSLGISTLSPAIVNINIGPATQLVMTGLPTTTGSGACTTVTVERRNIGGTPVTAGPALTVNLSSTATAGTLDLVPSTGTCSGRTPISSISIPMGSSSAQFAVRGKLVGSVTVTAASAPLTSAVGMTTVQPGDAKNLLMDMLGANTFVAGACVPFTLRTTDENGNATTSPPGGETVTLSGTTTNTTVGLAPQFFNNASCGDAPVTGAVALPSTPRTLSFKARSVTAAGGTTIGAAGNTLSGTPNAAFAVTAGQGEKVVITSAAVTTMPVNSCQGGTWGVIDAFGNPSTAPAAGIAFTLSTGSSTAAFFGNSQCTTSAPTTAASGAASGQFFVNNSTIQSFSVVLSSGFPPDSSQMWATVFSPPTKLVWKTTPPSPRQVGACLNAQLEMQDVNNAVVAASASNTLSVTLSAPSPTTNVFFFSNSTCTTPVTGALTFNTGSTFDVYFVPLTTGAAASVKADGSIVSPASTLTAATFSLNITGAAPALSVTAATNAVEAGGCLPLTVQRNAGGSAMTVGPNTVVDMSVATTPTLGLFSDSQCTTALPTTNSFTINGGSSSGTVYLRGNSGNGSTTFNVTAADSAAIYANNTQTFSALPLVRRGSCNTSGTTVTCPTNGSGTGVLNTSIDRTMLLVQAVGSNENVADATTECHLEPGNSTTANVVCTRAGSGGSINVTWQTATWGRPASAGGVSVNHGVINGTPSATPTTVTLDAGVDPTRAFVLLSTSSSGPASESDTHVDPNDFVAASLTGGGTTVTLDTSGFDGGVPLDSLAASVQVVSWANAEVTRSSSFTTNGGGDLTTISLASSNTKQSFPLMCAVSAPIDPAQYVCNRAFRTFSDDTNIYMSRAKGSTDTNCVSPVVNRLQAERINVPSGTSIATATVELTDTSANTFTLDAGVDLTRTVLFSATQGPGGQAWGEMTDDSNAKIGAAMANMTLTSGTEFTLQRRANDGSAKFTVYVVQFSP